MDAAARGEVSPGEEAGAGASIERRRPQARARALAALEGSLPGSRRPSADALAARNRREPLGRARRAGRRR